MLQGMKSIIWVMLFGMVMLSVVGLFKLWIIKKIKNSKNSKK